MSAREELPTALEDRDAALQALDGMAESRAIWRQRAKRAEAALTVAGYRLVGPDDPLPIRLRRLESAASALLRFINPCMVAEDFSQQWQSLSDQCMFAREELRGLSARESEQ